MGSLVAAGFQQLAEEILHQRGSPPLRSLLVTSCYRREGRTTISLCLARALARRGDARVVLMDGDFANPQLAKQLGLEAEPSFEDVLAGRAEPRDVAVKSLWDHVSVLLLRGPVEGREELLETDRLQRAMAEVQRSYDLVVIDGAPIFSSPNPLLALADVDTALIVARHGQTPERSIQQAARRLEEADVELLGVVRNFL
ncbi:MAG: tyrosine-protein kinase family protein [Pirellulales bacterium]